MKIPLEFDQIAGYEYVLFLSSIVTGWWIHGFLQSFMADSGSKEDLLLHQVFRDYSRLLLWMGGGILVVICAIIELLVYTGMLQSPTDGFYLYLFFHFILQAGILMVYYFHRKGSVREIYAMSVYVLVAYLGSFLILLDDKWHLYHAFLFLGFFSLPIVILWIKLYVGTVGSMGLSPGTGKYVPHLTTLMVIQSIGFISLWSDAFWVQYFYGTEEIFALFRYGGREFPLFIILTTTFSTAIIYQAKSTSGLRQIRRASRRYMWMFLPMAVGLMLASSHLFGWVYNDHFIPASMIFDLYLLLILIRVLFPRPILIAHRQFKSLLWISIGELFLNLVLSYTLYWPLGLFGLILASLIAHLFELGATIYVASTRLNISPRVYIPLRLYVFFALTLVTVLTIKYGITRPEWLVELWNP